MAGAVSAREDIIDFIEGNEPEHGFYDPQTGHGVYFRKEWLNHVGGLLDAYAHELAEKIRNSHGNPPEHCSERSKYTYDWHARRNADLIDPEQRT